MPRIGLEFSVRNGEWNGNTPLQDQLRNEEYHVITRDVNWFYHGGPTEQLSSGDKGDTGI
jgi:hypothetical protein